MTHVVQVSIPYYTGVPSDVVTNTFHFDWLGGGTAPAGAATDCFNNLATFYSNCFNQNATVGQMAAYMRPANTVMKMYNLDDPKPRVALLEATVPLTVFQDTTPTLPNETSIVLSYHTAYVGGIPKASQRGRIYLGGLGNACALTGTTVRFPQINVDLMEDIGTAGNILCSDSLSDDWGWVVYSTKLDQSFAVAGGWVDNAFDTQRRRGQAATNRDTWTD